MRCQRHIMSNLKMSYQVLQKDMIIAAFLNTALATNFATVDLKIDFNVQRQFICAAKNGWKSAIRKLSIRPPNLYFPARLDIFVKSFYLSIMKEGRYNVCDDDENCYSSIPCNQNA